LSNENAVRNLIRIDDKQNPTMFRALQLLIDDLYKINEEVFPTKPIAGEDQGGFAKPLGPVQNFTGTAYPTNLRLDWDNLDGAFRYQIKMGEDWDTARPIIVTATDVANVDPIFLNLVNDGPELGIYHFIIRAWNIESELGEAAFATLIIPQIPPPELSLQVVISTVLLRWTEPASSWKIDYYIVFRDGVEQGRINGTFKLIQEQSGGSYSYSVQAVDIVGNKSRMSAVKIADLHDPSEFEFVDELEADFTGTYVRTDDVIIQGIRGILGATNIYTWQEHFVNYNFASPQEQIDAGFPFYFQPTYLDVGYYEEDFDFGQVFENLTVIADYNKQQLSGTTNINTEISYSEDGITFTVPVIANSLLATKFRYVRIRWVFTNDGYLSAAFISNLKVVLNVTLTLDSGSSDCLASDIGGTEIFYNKEFKGISSVTATPSISIQPLYAVCDFITKDSFKILIFDSSGNRENATINWKARGVV